MRSHRDILKDWPSYSAVSRALAALGISISAMGVARWGQNDNIPPEYWPALIRAGEAKGFPISTIEMAEYCEHQLQLKAARRSEDQSCA